MITPGYEATVIFQKGPAAFLLFSAAVTAAAAAALIAGVYVLFFFLLSFESVYYSYGNLLTQMCRHMLCTAHKRNHIIMH